MGRNAYDARTPIAGGLLLAVTLSLTACVPPPAVGPTSTSTPSARPEIVLAALPSITTPDAGPLVPQGTPAKPERLTGLDMAALQRAIGSPSQRRREGPAEVWQYQGETCVMDVFLYPKKNAPNELSVTYVELRRQGVAQLKRPDERQRCYAEALAGGRRNVAKP